MVCTAASSRLRSSLPATVRYRARIRSLRIIRVGRTTRVVPTSAQGEPLSVGPLIWFTPVLTRAMIVRGLIGPAPAQGKGSRCASSTGRLTWPLTRGRTTMGVVLPPRGRALRAMVPAHGRGPDVVGFCPCADQEGAGRLGPSPSLPERHRRPPPGSPMGPRETARYGFRALRIGEASHPGPLDTDVGDRDRVRHAAVVAERVARIDELVAAMRAEYQTLQAERFGLVGAHTPGDPARVPPPDPPQSVRRSRTPSSAFSSPAQIVLPPPPMEAGRAIGPVRRPPPASLLGFVVTPGLVLGKATIPRLRPLARATRGLGP